MTDRDAAAGPRWLMPRGLIVVLAVTGLLVSVLATQQFTSILGPVPLALILAIGVHPLTGILRRRGAPMWPAVTVTLVTSTDHPAQGMSGAASRGTVPGKRCWAVPTVALHPGGHVTVPAASVSGHQRVGAAVALLAAVLTIAVAVVETISDFPEGLGVLGLVAIALGAAWFGVIRGGTQRVVGIVVAVLGLVGAAALLIRNGNWLSLVLLGLGIAIWHIAARAAFQPHLHRPVADRPRRPVLFINPWSGGGKAAKVGLAAEAAARGIRTVELRRGDDLTQLVRDAVNAGADGLAAAGGDGTQAIVATAAAEHGLPFACIPAGTRNHFALDLGVDRNDVVGALDALVDGGEHVVDLGDVNGRVFVNNVSMGLYAEAVQHEGYRNAKIRTLLDTAPTTLAPTGSELDLRWTGPDGTAHAVSGHRPGVQQPLPARPRRRLRDAPADRHRTTGHLRSARPPRGRRGRAETVHATEAVVGTRVPDRLGPPGPVGHRW